MDHSTSSPLAHLVSACSTTLSSYQSDLSNHHDWMDSFFEAVMNPSLTAAGQLKTPRRKALQGHSNSLLFSASRQGASPGPAARLFTGAGSALKPTTTKENLARSPLPPSQPQPQQSTFSSAVRQATVMLSGARSPPPALALPKPSSLARGPQSPSPRKARIGSPIPSSPAGGERAMMGLVVGSGKASRIPSPSPSPKKRMEVDVPPAAELLVEEEQDDDDVSMVEEEVEKEPEQTANLSIIGEEAEEDEAMLQEEMLIELEVEATQLHVDEETVAAAIPVPATVEEQEEVTMAVDAPLVDVGEKELLAAPASTSRSAAKAVDSPTAAPLFTPPLVPSMTSTSSALIPETQFPLPTQPLPHASPPHPEADESVPLNDAPSALRTAGLSSSIGHGSQSASKPAPRTLTFVGLPKKSLPFALRPSSSFVVGDSQSSQHPSSQSSQSTNATTMTPGPSSGPRGSLTNTEDAGKERRLALAHKLQSMGLKNAGRTSTISTSNAMTPHARQQLQAPLSPPPASTSFHAPKSPPPPVSHSTTFHPSASARPLSPSLSVQTFNLPASASARPLSPPPLPLPPSMSMQQMLSSSISTASLNPTANAGNGTGLVRKPSTNVRDAVRDFEVRAASPGPSSSSRFTNPSKGGPMSPPSMGASRFASTSAASTRPASPAPAGRFRPNTAASKSPMKNWFGASSTMVSEEEEKEVDVIVEKKREKALPAAPSAATAAQKVSVVEKEVSVVVESQTIEKVTVAVEQKKAAPKAVEQALPPPLALPFATTPASHPTTPVKAVASPPKSSTTPIDSPPVRPKKSPARPIVPAVLASPSSTASTTSASKTPQSSVVVASPPSLPPLPSIRETSSLPTTVDVEVDSDSEADSDEDERNEIRVVGDMLGLGEESLRFGDESSDSEREGDDDEDDGEMDLPSLPPRLDASDAEDEGDGEEEGQGVQNGFAMEVDQAFRSVQASHSAATILAPVSSKTKLDTKTATTGSPSGKGKMPGAFLDEGSDEETSRSLSKQSSNASLASTVAAQGAGAGQGVLGGLFGKLAGGSGSIGPGGKRVEGGNGKGVKSIQLAAAAAKKEKEDKERRAAAKEEREQKRLAVLNRKQEEERVKLDEEKRAIEKKRKERDDGVRASHATGGPKIVRPAGAIKPSKTERAFDDEPGKKRKVEPANTSGVLKKPPTVSRPLTASTSSTNLHASLNSSMSRPPALGKPTTASGTNPLQKSSSSAAPGVGQKFLNLGGTALAASSSASGANPARVGNNGYSANQQHNSTTIKAYAPAPPAPVASVSKPPAKPEKYIPLPDIDSEYSSEGEDAQNEKKAAYPQWARSPTNLLRRQETINPDDVFGPIPTLQMREIFPTVQNSSRFTRRTSSARWEGADALTEYEEERYRVRMGYVSMKVDQFGQ